MYLTFCTLLFIFSRFNIPRTKVQLIGAGVLLLAGKLEESYRAPTVANLRFACDELYTEQEIVKVESLILKVLRWRVAAPTPHVIAKLVLVRRETAMRERGHVAMRRDNTRAPQNREFRTPHFNTRLMALAMQLCDIASLDIEVWFFASFVV